MRWSRLVMSVLALTIGLTGPAEAAPADVRVLTWNIWRGGLGAGADNLPRLLDQVVATRPDVLLAVETYGAGEQIRQALTDRAGKGRYSGTQITPSTTGGDNLWIFTRYPVTRTYPAPAGGKVTAFNFGGVQVRLPGGKHLNLFDTWLPYTDPWNGYLIDENAAARRAGLPPRHTPAAVAEAETAQTTYLTEIITRHLPDGPAVLGGDFNTPAASDWTDRWQGCPNHFGMTYPLRTTDLLVEAGFTDTFRAAHPDACTAEGRTWSPQPTERMITPQRIDLTFARGATVTGSQVLDTRLPRHGPGVFYSDHAALLSTVRVR
ncbi:endonuclease/exonuclease/phosphatase family protein [Crossiella sp. SN42]|uniref:endonuclease/exonuclease/phosphatase family protein n=1 Tax=Crossiella sp. SN42 TaxID=2944808 RepID=UPI00207CD43B|nr:endonuclease/exonuclease/phosphatase family protein [Crossiella sp. SN42]MCO1577092.1 endonuclease/exonuclease/phosphatase family protein [Crossiella sp. SN42]